MSEAEPVVENKIHKIYARTANFGFSAPSEDKLTAASGTKKRADVAEKLASFVAPRQYEAQSRQLQRRNIVVLGGPSGLGKRTGALALTYHATELDLVQLSPEATMDELRGTEYQAGTGYFIVDYAPPPEEKSGEFKWETLCDSVRTAGAFLVVTTALALPFAPVEEWGRPDLQALLDKALADVEHGPEIARQLVRDVPNDWTLPSISRLIRQVRDDPANAKRHLQDVFDLDAIEEVGQWFAANEDEWVDIAEVTTLAFAWGSGERRFEALARRLGTELTESLQLDTTSDEAKAKAAAAARTPRRRRRAAGLIRVVPAGDGGLRQTLAFKAQPYRRHVLSALHERYDLPFWDGLRRWIYALVEEEDAADDDELWQLSQGVALLAEVNPEEAIEEYVRPWAGGKHGITAMGCAAAALCGMAGTEAAAPIARQLAAEWAGSRNLSERITAGAAFSGELGLRYPGEALRRLWQLISQDDLLGGFALDAPGDLLAFMVEVKADPTELLAGLEQRLRRLSGRRVEPRTVDLTLETIMRLLAVRAEDDRRLAVFDLVVAQPGTPGPVARLWAGVLANRRYRVRALEALWDGLSASPDPARVAGIIGDALAAALEPAAYAMFTRDFKTIDRRRRHGQKQVASLADVLISAVARMCTPVTTEAVR